MGAKNLPSPHDCFDRALPSEPYFTLLARDIFAPGLVRAWANEREIQVDVGNKPAEDLIQVGEARELARSMEAWRLEHEGEWRTAAKEDDPRMHESQPARASLHLEARKVK